MNEDIGNERDGVQIEFLRWCNIRMMSLLTHRIHKKYVYVYIKIFANELCSRKNPCDKARCGNGIHCSFTYTTRIKNRRPYSARYLSPFSRDLPTDPLLFQRDHSRPKCECIRRFTYLFVCIYVNV